MLMAATNGRFLYPRRARLNTAQPEGSRPMPETQAQVQTQKQTPEVKEIQIHPIAPEVLPDTWTVPALQAYDCSPNWLPVLLRDAIIYIWPHTVAEALLVPRPSSTGEKSRLYYVTRRTCKILLFLVDTHIPGGRVSNLYAEPLVFDSFTTEQFIAAFIFYSINRPADDIAKLSLYCSPAGSAVLCHSGSKRYQVEYRPHELRVVVTEQ